MNDLERKLEELYMSDSRSRRVGSVDVLVRRPNPFASLALIGGVAALALVAIAVFSLLRGGRADLPATSPSPSGSALIAAPSASATASPTIAATSGPSGKPGVQPDARYGVIVATGNMRTETDPRGLQEPSLFMTAPTTSYAVSPEGRRIALISRTGEQLVTFTTDRPNAVTTVVDLTGSGELAMNVVWAGDGSNSILFAAVKQTRDAASGARVFDYAALRSVDPGTREVREVARISGQNSWLWPIAWLPARQIAAALEVRTLRPIVSYVTVRSGTVERTAISPNPNSDSFSASRDGQRVVLTTPTGIRWWPTDQPGAAKDLPARAGETVGHAEFRPGADEVGVDVGAAFEVWTLTGQRRVVAPRVPGFERWRVDGSAAIASSDPSQVTLIDPATGATVPLPGGGFPLADVVMF